MADEVLTERRGRVLLITLNRPDDRNAINLSWPKGCCGRSKSSTATTASPPVC